MGAVTIISAVRTVPEAVKLCGVDAVPERDVKAAREPDVEMPWVTLQVIETEPFPELAPAEFD